MKQRLIIINLALLPVLGGLVFAFFSVISSTNDLPDFEEAPTSDRIAQVDTLDHTNPNPRTRYDIVRSNDLFRPERRPFVPPKVVNTPPTPTPTPKGTPVPPPQGLRLAATFYLGRERFALISERTIQNGEPKRYMKGDSLLDYIISRIEPDQVILAKAGADPLTLPLRDFTNLPDPEPPQQQNQRQGGRGGNRAFVNEQPKVPPIPQAEVDQKENLNPFEALSEALRKAKRDREEQGFEVPDIEDPPPLPDFLKKLGAGQNNDDDNDESFDEE